MTFGNDERWQPIKNKLPHQNLNILALSFSPLHQAFNSLVQACNESLIFWSKHVHFFNSNFYSIMRFFGPITIPSNMQSVIQICNRSVRTCDPLNSMQPFLFEFAIDPSFKHVILRFEPVICPQAFASNMQSMSNMQFFGSNTLRFASSVRIFGSNICYYQWNIILRSEYVPPYFEHSYNAMVVIQTCYLSIRSCYLAAIKFRFSFIRWIDDSLHAMNQLNVW